MNQVGYRVLQFTLAATLLPAAPHLAFAGEARINIVAGYEGMAQYAAAAIGKSNTERATLYDQYVNQPYRERCSGDGDGREFSRRMLETPVADIDALAHAAAEISDSRIEDKIRVAIRESSRLMPIDDITVCVFAFPPDHSMADLVREKLYGLMGFAEIRGVFWLQPLPVNGWLDQLAYGTAHEYHHAAAYSANRDPGKDETLLETILAEGRADAFAALLYPERVPAWTDALSLEQERATWTAMTPYLDRRDNDIVNKFLFGSEGEAPLWSGYTIGFRIAQSYIAQNPGESVEQWSILDAGTFLRNSGYGVDGD